MAETLAALALFAAPAYLARRGVPQTLAELAQHDCVVFEGMRAWSLVGPRGAETARPAGVLVADSMAFVSSAVGAGPGVVWPPSPFVPRRVTLLRDYLIERLRARYVACEKALGELGATDAAPRSLKAPT